MNALFFVILWNSFNKFVRSFVASFFYFFSIFGCQFINFRWCHPITSNVYLLSPNVFGSFWIENVLNRLAFFVFVISTNQIKHCEIVSGAFFILSIHTDNLMAICWLFQHSVPEDGKRRTNNNECCYVCASARLQCDRANEMKRTQPIDRLVKSSLWAITSEHTIRMKFMFGRSINDKIFGKMR